MRADLARSLRRIKPERFSGTLTRRNDSDLPFASAERLFGSALLLDTCVYIDILEASLPPEVERLLPARELQHLSIVLGELAHSFGRLNPAHPGTREHLEALAGVIEDIPLHRLDDSISAAYRWRLASWPDWRTVSAAFKGVRRSRRSMTQRSTCMPWNTASPS